MCTIEFDRYKKQKIYTFNHFFSIASIDAPRNVYSQADVAAEPRECTYMIWLGTETKIKLKENNKKRIE